MDLSVGNDHDRIKQCEIITIRGNRVRAGQVLMLVIDMVQSVFGWGYQGCLWTRRDNVGGCRGV